MNYPRRAIEVLATYGWHQGDLGNAIVGVCIAGALLKAYSGQYEGYRTGTDDIVVGVIKDQYPDRYDPRHQFSAFNDHPDTRIEDVIAVLEKAALKVDERV